MSELVPSAKTREQIMSLYGFIDYDEFESCLIDLDIDPDCEFITPSEEEKIKNHVLSVAESKKEMADNNKKASPLEIAFKAQGIASQQGFNINSEALLSLAQCSFNEGVLQAFLATEIEKRAYLASQARFRADFYQEISEQAMARSEAIQSALNVEEILKQHGLDQNTLDEEAKKSSAHLSNLRENLSALTQEMLKPR